MSDSNWEGATWDEDGVLVLDIHPDHEDYDGRDGAKNYVWVGDESETALGNFMCDVCEKLDGTTFEYFGDAPEKPHPNCRCKIKEKRTGKEYDPHPWTGKENCYGKTIYGDLIYINKDGTRSVHPHWNSAYNRARYSPNGKERLRAYHRKVEQDEQKRLAKIEKRKEENQRYTNVFEGHTFAPTAPLNLKPKQEALFDGRGLHIYENGVRVHSFNAISGMPGFQNPRYQDVVRSGPIPEGMYALRQNRHQAFRDRNLRSRTGELIGGGAWRGGQLSWGDYRVWLEPSAQTDTLGRTRTGFAVHGSTREIPQSGGCINLHRDMNEFIEWFTNNNHDIIIRVMY